MVTIGIVYHAMSHPCHNNNRVTTGISSLHMKKSNSSIFFNPYFFRFFFSDLTFSFLRKRRHDVIEFKEICLCTVASSFHKKKNKEGNHGKLEIKEKRNMLLLDPWNPPNSCPVLDWFSASPPRNSNALHSEGKWTAFSSIWNKFKRDYPARGKIMLQHGTWIKKNNFYN